MMKLSVISSCSRDGFQAGLLQQLLRRSIICGWPSWAPARLTDSGPNGACSFCHSPICWQALPDPVAEGRDPAANPRRGDEALGEISPNSGWYQRTGASAPTSGPLSGSAGLVSARCNSSR